MTPKEKAEELIEKFTMDETRQAERNAIKCALITVDEIIKQCWDYRDIDLEVSCDYWKQVKQEIINL